MYLKEENIDVTHKKMNSKLLEKKSEKVDPYGLVKRTMSLEEDQLTPYDSFLFEDSLRISSDSFSKIKEKFSSRFNPSTGLYDVTVGDTNTEYYYYATMLNRMTNHVYSMKVHRCATLLRNMMNNIRKDCYSMVEKTSNDISWSLKGDFDFSEAYEDELRKRTGR